MRGGRRAWCTEPWSGAITNSTISPWDTRSCPVAERKAAPRGYFDAFLFSAARAFGLLPFLFDFETASCFAASSALSAHGFISARPVKTSGGA
jgi:hypothetical protein